MNNTDKARILQQAAEIMEELADEIDHDPEAWRAAKHERQSHLTAAAHWLTRESEALAQLAMF